MEALWIAVLLVWHVVVPAVVVITKEDVGRKTVRPKVETVAESPRCELRGAVTACPEQIFQAN